MEENQGCAICYECQHCFSSQDGAQGPQQRRPDGRMMCPRMRGGMPPCGQMQQGQQGGRTSCPHGNPRGPQGLTEAKVKEIVLDLLIVAGVIEEKNREGIEIE